MTTTMAPRKTMKAGTAGWLAAPPDKSVVTAAMKWPVSRPAPWATADDSLIGDRQPHLDQLDGNGGEQQGQWHVDDNGPQQHREVLSVDRLDHAEEQHGQHDDAAQRGHRLVVLSEPRGPEVDRGGRGQHRSDLIEQPHRTLGHPAT